MNAIARISDQHSIEFDFECLDIEVEGLRFAEVSGTAELAVNDHDDGSFYVKHIVLNGTRKHSFSTRWEPSKQHIYRAGPEQRTFTAHLFRAIETALYSYRPAEEAWRSELENA